MDSNVKGGHGILGKGVYYGPELLSSDIGGILSVAHLASLEE